MYEAKATDCGGSGLEVGLLSSCMLMKLSDHIQAHIPHEFSKQILSPNNQKEWSEELHLFRLLFISIFLCNSHPFLFDYDLIPLPDDFSRTFFNIIPFIIFIHLIYMSIMLILLQFTMKNKIRQLEGNMKG